MANSISDKLKIKPKFSLKELKLPDDLAAALNKNKKEGCLLQYTFVYQ